MSHKKIKVAGQEPNASGNIALSNINIEDLSNVTLTSLGADQVLKFDGSSWVNGSPAGGSSEILRIGRGESDQYSNTGLAGSYSHIKSDYTYFYDTAPTNTITGASVSKVSGTDWIESITLPAGKYYVMGQWIPKFSSAGTMAGTLYSTTAGVERTVRAIIGDNTGNSEQCGSTVIASYFELTQAEELKYKIYNYLWAGNIDTVTNQGTYVSENSRLLFVKLG
jgi:hypothetical protein